MLDFGAVDSTPVDATPGGTTSTPPPPPTVVRKLRRGQVVVGDPIPLAMLDGSVVRNRRGRTRWTLYSQVYQDGFRIANTALEVYELYVGYGQAPDFEASGQPVATSATLPFNWTPTVPSGGMVLHLVVRKRNRYNLQSFNVYETILQVDSGGVEVPGPLSAPHDVAVHDAATGYIRVVTKYLSTEDSLPADTWDVYVKIGADPVIGVDPVAFTGGMTFIGVEAGLAQDIGSYTAGTIAHVLVAVRRSSDNTRALASVVQHVLRVPLDLTDGQIFGGAVFEQR